MAEGDVRVPAGWYPDPLGLPQLRWWDNHAWTEYTSDARQPMVAQETVTQQARLAYADDDEDGLTRRERRERERDGDGDLATDSDAVTPEPEIVQPAAEVLLSLEAPVKEAVVEEELSPAAKFAEFVPTNAPTTPAFNLDSRFDDLLGDSVGSRSAFSHVSESTTTFVPDGSFGMPAQAAPTAAPATATPSTISTSTSGAWLVAVTPLFSLLVAMFYLTANMREGAPIATAFIILVPYLGTIGLAYLDTRQLKAKGIERPAHWLFALLGAPVYLVARFVGTVRQTGRGFGPIAAWAALAAMAVVAVVGIPGMVIALQPATFAGQVEQAVMQDAGTLGANIDVQCPDKPPTIVGQSFTCVAKQNAVKNPVSWGITVSLQRANGWIDWRVDDWGIFTLGASPSTLDD